MTVAEPSAMNRPAHIDADAIMSSHEAVVGSHQESPPGRIARSASAIRRKPKGSNSPVLFPLRAFLSISVIVEAIVGLTPIAGIVWWHWDAFLVLMLHLLALAVSAAWLVLRTVTLSSKAMGHFESAPGCRVHPTARYILAGFTLFVLALPLVLFIAIISEDVSSPWRSSIHGPGDFWQVVVVSSGLWLPLALVCAWEGAWFFADVVLPVVFSKRGFAAPVRPIHPGYAGLSRELQAFLFVRALIVLRMVVTVMAVGIGFVLAGGVGVLALAVVLALVKTAVAVFLQAGAAVDAETRASRA